ncbi:MAG: LamG domain-containing protein [Planctomycetota bacterium]
MRLNRALAALSSCALASAAAAQCTVIPEGPYDHLIIELSPIHYWSFNDPAGDAIDHGAAFHDVHADWGNLASRLTQTVRSDLVGGSARFINGLSGNAARVITIDHWPTMATPEATVVLVIKPESNLPAGSTLLDKTFAGQSLALTLSPDPEARADGSMLELSVNNTTIGPGSEVGAATDGVLEADAWHVVAFTFASDGLRLWANGNVVAHDPTLTNGLTSHQGEWTLGAADDLRDIYAGLVDEMWFFDRALPEDELDRIHDCLMHDVCAATQPVACSPADVTTSGACAFGQPDAAVDLSDFSCYLATWASNDERADLTSFGSGNGLPDGSVDLSDFGYYLNQWATGCP